MEADLSQKTVAKYASYALNVRNRQDVYNACVILIRDWHMYSGNEERRAIFEKISRESVGNPRLKVNAPNQLNRVYQGWKQENVLGNSDAVSDAYERELNKK